MTCPDQALRDDAGKAIERKVRRFSRDTVRKARDAIMLKFVEEIK